MVSEIDVHGAPARGGGTARGGGLLARRPGGSAGSTRAETTDAATRSQSTAEDSTPYGVTIEPAGSRASEGWPERYASLPGVWMDVATAPGVRSTAGVSLDRRSLERCDAPPGVAVGAGVVRTPGESAGSQDDGDAPRVADVVEGAV